MKLNVLLVSNQVRGIDGTGGLGDVANALPKALADRGDIDIRVMTPGYAIVSGKNIEDRFENVISRIAIPIGNKIIIGHLCKYIIPKSKQSEPSICCYLIRTDDFDRATDSATQAILLCRAALECIKSIEDFRPDIIHCNDWHSGLIPVYLNTLFDSDHFLSRIATLYTTHNTGLGYQGAFPSETFPSPPNPSSDELLHLSGLSTTDSEGNFLYFQAGQSHSLEHGKQFNFAKGGFAYSDVINTVSATYAREILSPAFSGGFHGLFQERRADLCGIVDGIDLVEWDPAFDPNIAPYNYSRSDIRDAIEKKTQIKSVLREWADPKTGNRPFAALDGDSVLVALVGRIADQKFAILLPRMEDICSLENTQTVILGSAHPADNKGIAYAERVRDLASRLQKQLTFFEGFDIPLSHIIYAAADIFLVPSSYEPCGLTQLISMRYGTIPVVRFVGGLIDTVKDEAAGEDANGFGFREEVSSPDEMADALRASDRLFDCVKRALTTKKEKPQRWEELMRNAMWLDSGWSVPASQYVKLYHAAVARRVNRRFFLSRLER